MIYFPAVIKVNKYNSAKDYYFRVKAANEFGVSEPSMPAMLRKKEGWCNSIIIILSSVQYNNVMRCSGDHVSYANISIFIR